MLSGEMITIRLPRQSKDEEDVSVWVNERRFLIKRGVSVDVPVEVWKILQQSEKMQEVIYEYENANAR
jgi:hypothetical protein